jgi:glycosyltransferase involved in cell wall biosynthesis
MPSEKKKKILFQSDSALAKTGFGRNSKAILSYLYKTGKYDIVHYCGGVNYSNPDLARTPWKSVGCLPDDQKQIERLNRDPNLARMAAYGSELIDKVVKDEKPDVYIAVQDIWGVDFAVNKPWFDKINSIIWTTLDSLPILPSAIEKASKIKHYWIWSDFATQVLNEMGHKHVRTVHGAIDDTNFIRLSDEKRANLRKEMNIPADAFITGFVFRNQLRKSVPNLLEGYQMWKKKNNIKNSYLLLHTHFKEGWNIHKLADEYGVDKREILTTYICKKCANYEVKAHIGEEQECRSCGDKKGLITTGVSCGVTEEQLNEVYNLMDVYCHPFTSGGQEIPIQEAKLTELITLVTNYSCGEEMCMPEAASLTLDWSEYREHGTEFRKASTKPYSIAKQLGKVYNMKPKERKKLGKKAREWTVKNFSVTSVGKFIEEYLDSLPDHSYNFEEVKKQLKNPDAQIPNIEDDSKWILTMYHEILKMKQVNEEDDGYKYWMSAIAKGMSRQEIENYFRDVAKNDNKKITKDVSFEDQLDKDDKGKRLLYVMPESIGDVFMSTSLFRSIKELYPEFNLYVATKPENFDILQGNKEVHKVIPWMSEMENQLWLEGHGKHKGYFEIAFLPFVNTQRILTYLHNGKDKIAYSDLAYAPN